MALTYRKQKLTTLKEEINKSIVTIVLNLHLLVTDRTIKEKESVIIEKIWIIWLTNLI